MPNRSIAPTSQWREPDPTITVPIALVYLMADPVSGVLGVTDNPADATHMFARDPESGVVGIMEYAPAESQLAKRAGVILPTRIIDALVMQLTPATIDFAGIEFGDDPNPQEVEITAADSVSNLSASIEYGDVEPVGWLSAVLDQTTTPAILTLNAETGALTAGTYHATVTIDGDLLVSPKTVDVTFEVWGPLMMPGLRLFLHAPYEAARRGLTTVGARAVEDRFNRANGPIGNAETGQPWTTYGAGAWSVLSNAAVADGANRTAVIDAGIVNQIVRAALTNGNASARVGLVVRNIDAGNGLRVLVSANSAAANPGTVRLTKLDGGVETELASAAYASGSGTVTRLRVECAGDNIKVYINGTVFLDHTLAGGDAIKFTDPNATRCGMMVVANTPSTFDNFRVDSPNTTAPLDAITDDSGNGFGAAQAAVAQRPVLLWDGLRWAIRSDGVDDIMLGSANVSSASSGYVLAALGGFAAYGANIPVFASSDEASASRYVFLHARVGSGEARVSQRNNDTDDALRGHTAGVLFAPRLMGWGSDDASFRLFNNGVEQAKTVESGADTGDWFAETTDRDNYTICGFKRTTESNFTPMDLCSLILVDGYPSSADRARLDRWANAANALGIAL